MVQTHDALLHLSSARFVRLVLQQCKGALHLFIRCEVLHSNLLTPDEIPNLEPGRDMQCKTRPLGIADRAKTKYPPQENATQTRYQRYSLPRSNFVINNDLKSSRNPNAASRFRPFVLMQRRGEAQNGDAQRTVRLWLSNGLQEDLDSFGQQFLDTKASTPTAKY
jgi:hypothetical protein